MSSSRAGIRRPYDHACTHSDGLGAVAAGLVRLRAPDLVAAG